MGCFTHADQTVRPFRPAFAALVKDDSFGDMCPHGRVVSLVKRGMHSESSCRQCNTESKPAYREREAARRAGPRAVRWADQKAMVAVYRACAKATVETGEVHHVDHVIPLRGELVSGLHVPTNLQVLTGPANSSKGNRFEP
jgi:hypothetical protein